MVAKYREQKPLPSLRLGFGFIFWGFGVCALPSQIHGDYIEKGAKSGNSFSRVKASD